jgi:hypothetical protein
MKQELLSEVNSIVEREEKKRLLQEWLGRPELIQVI